MRVFLVLFGLFASVLARHNIITDYHESIGIPLAQKIKQAESAVDFDGSRIIGGTPSLLAQTGIGSNTYLRKVDQRVISNADCDRFYIDGVVVPGTLCTDTVGGTRGTCGGDSGGPLSIRSGYDRTLIGVLSFVSTAGCESGTPAGSTRVTSYYNWIRARLV
ncbi:unnamed protein product [Leptidea sinapis]|uniref:Peptidase S1 domain-containing protein n=1 Tax=Leptidea sinapis TaxID=189913 RepID=A0A5E4PMC0_9NEOP|nr:unnamed protein product [Leptidea sinapis]